MPLVYQHNINEATKLGVWHITEPEYFFLEKVPLNKGVSHPHKRLQHLAGRYLLPFLFADFPLAEIVIADTRKPFLENEQYHFSISHCSNYAAAIVSTKERVGVDIELITPKIDNIQHKFIGEKEWIFIEKTYEKFEDSFYKKEKIKTDFLTLLWSAKEAIFKWHGLGQMDFKKHMQLNGDFVFTKNEMCQLPFLFAKQKNQQLTIHATFLNQLVLAWLHT